jgi:dethiobiotin synthetase
MSQQRWFVTGTDTGVGKTRIAAGMLAALAARGLSTAAYKPVATGCLPGGDGLRNEDAVILQDAVTQRIDYERINPVALAPAIAPHLAAAEVSVTLDAAELASMADRLPSADGLVIEGAGGWRVPLSSTETMADLALALCAPVVLVVGIRLGCLNHALLTADAIERDGAVFAGWVANIMEPEPERVADQIASLEQRLNAPMLGRVPWLTRPEPTDVARCLDQTAW